MGRWSGQDIKRKDSTVSSTVTNVKKRGRRKEGNKYASQVFK